MVSSPIQITASSLSSGAGAAEAEAAVDGSTTTTTTTTTTAAAAAAAADVTSEMKLHRVLRSTHAQLWQPRAPLGIVTLQTAAGG